MNERKGQEARDAMRNGKIPSRRPERMWGGAGSGARYAICNAAVRPDQTELELEFACTEDHPGHCNPLVHSRCFLEWENACREAERRRGTGPAGREGSSPAGIGAASKPN